MAAHPEPKRGRPRSEESRQAILDAAWRLAELNPLSKVSIEAVAREAGVGKTTIYRWWPSRPALLCDAFLHAIEPIISFPEAPSASEAIAKQMRSLVRAFQGEFGRLVRELLAETASDPEALKLFGERFVKPRRAVAKHLIEKGISAGEFRPDLEPEVVIDILYGPLYYRLLVQHLPLTEDFAVQLSATATKALSQGNP